MVESIQLMKILAGYHNGNQKERAWHNNVKRSLGSGHHVVFHLLMRPMFDRFSEVERTLNCI